MGDGPVVGFALALLGLALAAGLAAGRGLGRRSDDDSDRTRGLSRDEGRGETGSPALSAWGCGHAPFVAAVTHQLNNRLHLIRGLSDLAMRNGAEADPADLARISEMVDESASLLRRLAVLTKDTSPAAEPLDLGEHMAELVRFARPIVGGRLEIEAVAPSDPLRVVAGAEPLLQAGTALLILAAARQGRRGRIEIRAQPIATGHVAMEIVGDARASEDTDADAEAALGIALDRIADAGGELEVDSGSRVQRFRIVLEPKDEATLRPSSSDPTHVLVVDASAEARASICEPLEEAGFRSWEAADGREAVAIAHRVQPIALLIVDLLLESETGSEVRERVQAEQPDVGVLYTTSFPGVLGADAHAASPPLPKPFKPDELLTRVRETLDASAR